MEWQQKMILLVGLCLATGTWAAPQAQQLPATQQVGEFGPQPSFDSRVLQAAASAPVAQSRDAPVYPETAYSTGFSNGGGQAYGAPAAAASNSYAAPQGGYGAPSTNYGQPGGNTGYYYYYYPVQEQKGDYQAAKGDYQATDSYGIDPLGIIAVLAVAGLVIAGLALLFPGWAYVRSDENVYYRSLDGSPSFLGLSKEDYRTLTSLVLTAIEGENCYDKMMCDAGKLVKKIKKADAFLRIMEDLAPSSVSGSIKKLRTAIKKPDECKNVGCAKKKVL